LLVQGVKQERCYVYERVIFRSRTFLFEKTVGKDYHNVLWKEHFRSILLYVDNYVLEAEDERLQRRCILSFRNYFTDYKRVLMQNDDIILPSSFKQQLPLGKKLVMHSSYFPKLTLACHPAAWPDEASVFREVSSLDRTKEIHITDIRGLFRK